jgi:hypothetical protein
MIVPVKRLHTDKLMFELSQWFEVETKSMYGKLMFGSYVYELRPFSM